MASGGPASWGRAVEDALDAMYEDLAWVNCITAMGHGTAALGRILACSEDGSTGVYTATLGNTYADFGWDGAHFIRPGMLIDIYNGSSIVTTAGGIRVTSVTRTPRKNGAFVSDTIVFSDTTGLTIAGNYIVYLGNSRNNLPMGLTGIIQNSNGGTFADAYAGVASVTTFETLTRASYSSLMSNVYQATDFGPDAASPADGTPTDWDLSVISDAIEDIANGTGRGKINHLLCNGKLARAIHRRMKSESNLTVTIDSTGSERQSAVGDQVANKFICPDGRVIPIHVNNIFPNNCLFGLTKENLIFFPYGDFDFHRPYGEVWCKTMGDRKLNFEAPYGGKYELGAERCDNFFKIEDMRDDIS
jgi:hypothetical protein